MRPLCCLLVAASIAHNSLAQESRELAVQLDGNHATSNRTWYQDRAAFSADGARVAITYQSRLHCFATETAQLLGKLDDDKNLIGNVVFLGNDQILCFLAGVQQWGVVSVDDLMRLDNATLRILPLKRVPKTSLHYFGQLANGELVFARFSRLNDGIHDAGVSDKKHVQAFESLIENPNENPGSWFVLTQQAGEWSSRQVYCDIPQVQAGNHRRGSLLALRGFTNLKNRRVQLIVCSGVSASPGPIRLAQITESRDGHDARGRLHPMNMRIRTEVTPIKLTRKSHQLIVEKEPAWSSPGALVDLSRQANVATGRTAVNTHPSPLIVRHDERVPTASVASNPRLADYRLLSSDGFVGDWHGASGWLSLDLKRNQQLRSGKRAIPTDAWIASPSLDQWIRLDTGDGLESCVLAVSENGRFAITQTTTRLKTQRGPAQKRWQLWDLESVLDANVLEN